MLTLQLWQRSKICLLAASSALIFSCIWCVRRETKHLNNKLIFVKDDSIARVDVDKIKDKSATLTALRSQELADSYAVE